MKTINQFFLLVSLIMLSVCVPVFSDSAKSESKVVLAKGIIEESKEHCQETIQLLDQMDAILKEAKKSNDPQAMKLALDGLEKPLTDIKEHLNLVIKNLNTHKNMDQKKTMPEKGKSNK